MFQSKFSNTLFSHFPYTKSSQTIIHKFLKTLTTNLIQILVTKAQFYSHDIIFKQNTYRIKKKKKNLLKVNMKKMSLA